MRHLAAGLILALAVAIVVFFAVSPARGWWLPEGASNFAEPVDRLFDAILVVAAVALVVVLGLLSFAVWRGARPATGPARSVHGNARLEIAWSAVVGLVLLSIAVAQMPTWSALRDPAAAPRGAPTAAVIAQQFAWNFAYAGDDGTLGSADDLETAGELVLPAGEPVLLALRSRDVIHSFFVPALRIKQDVLPGRAIPLWFTITRPGEYELVCAELCGWGHYAMAGKVRALPRSEYDAWLAQRARERLSTGAEERR